MASQLLAERSTGRQFLEIPSQTVLGAFGLRHYKVLCEHYLYSSSAIALVPPPPPPPRSTLKRVPRRATPVDRQARSAG